MNTPTVAARGVLRFSTACQECGLSVSTMRRLIRAGRGPRILQLSERRIGIRRTDLDEWLTSREGATF
ncbi:helix-turn-helix transcriptional regulator [Methylobacterium oxalidis]|uniref:helix-turn-helix transcriptional regulator n=1 Tax=Methylobacterium oxalidis TaxID=944322 RepID=UPI0011BF7F02|nr:helix-turn-helix domain-containing protein [Methylobacterium oxalidis]